MSNTFMMKRYGVDTTFTIGEIVTIQLNTFKGYAIIIAPRHSETIPRIYVRTLPDGAPRKVSTEQIIM